MKEKSLILVSTFFAANFYCQNNALSNEENYIYSKTYLSDPSLPNPKSVETVQYIDGLGRPKQIVNIKASPLGRDVVTHIEYDGFGRQVKDFLPVPQSGTMNGAIVPNPLANATQPEIYGAEKIYAEKILENSPLDRIQQQIQVGTDWSSKPVKFEYDANTEGEVKKYTATFNYSTFESQITLSATGYGANQLYKNTVTDEDGNKTVEFKNGQGQTILLRKMLEGTASADTYYVYNDYNQLAYVIPPLAVAANAVDETTLNNLCYRYKYDTRNRLVEKKIPGKGWEYMVYDKADRLIMTQDANFQLQQQWLITKYDRFGRVSYTGIIQGGSRENMQSQAGNIVITEARNDIGFTRNGMQIYYSNGYFLDIHTVLSVNYYDTYPTGSPAVPTQVLGQNVLTQDAQNSNISTKSLPVASYVKNIEDDNWTKNYTWYDIKGRPVGGHSINHLGGYTKTESELDFSGTPKQVLTRHKRLATDTERVITENFTYDHQNRLLVHTHQVDNQPVEYLVQNKYNELSQIETKKVGGVNLGSGLQAVDYKYNIRGWMTHINDPLNLGSDLFGYKIKYNQVEGLETPDWMNSDLQVRPRFNGNIAEVDWKTATVSNGNSHRYGYVYDGLNRLSAGFYQRDTDPSMREYYEKVTYDLNGNIQTLERTTAANFVQAIKTDHLFYRYKFAGKSNVLESIQDVSENKSGYPFYPVRKIISYDSNGNMTNHLDKGISSIKYNILNLPNEILTSPELFSNTYQLHYKYKANGEKVQKIYKTTQMDVVGNWEPVELKTDYLDGFQYSQDIEYGSVNPLKLQFVPTSEGYFDYVKNKYIYNYTDHLGNVRLSYLNNGSTIEILEENNYYPFGLKHEGYTTLGGNQSYQYKYNGKEIQETGMYDYGARFYMPDIGRWGVVDPLAEKMRRHSPYNYAFNNPINFIDPNGREGTGWGLKDNQWQFVAGMQEGDAAYQQGGYSDFRADGSVEPNVEITNSTAENTGLTYLGFNGETSYMPANSNGSTGMLGLSNWFRDAISGAESSIAGLFRNTNEEFPQITYNGGTARTDFDASTHDKLRPGDKTFTLDWGSFVAPSTFPVEGLAGGRGYALSWATDRMADIFNLNKGGGKDTLFMKATFVGNGKDYLRDTMFAEPYRKNETTEQVLNRQNKKFDSVKAKSKIFLTR